MVRPLAAAAVQVTSRAGFDGALNCVRVTAGVPGLPASMSVTLMVMLMTASCVVPGTVYSIVPL